MPDALMTELTPMEHSQNIVGSCSFRVLGRTLPSSVPDKLPGSTAQDGSPHKKGTAVSRQRPSDYCD